MKSLILSLQLLFMPVSGQADLITFVDREGRTMEMAESRSFYTFYKDPLFIETHRIKAFGEKLNKQIYKAPANAKLSPYGTILPSIHGEELDRLQFEISMRAALLRGGPQDIVVPTKTEYPRVTAEMLSEIKENRIGSYVTYYPEGNRERTHNIKLAAEAIDNQVLFPGERFSFNQVVGERTKEKGYLRAPVIIKGEFTEDVGGGICQVSSTLYNAVNIRGIAIIERYAHSREVTYVPPGKDATVSWNGPDFVFQNTYNQPVLILAAAQHGKVSISIFSSNDAKQK